MPPLQVQALRHRALLAVESVLPQAVSAAFVHVPRGATQAYRRRRRRRRLIVKEAHIPQHRA